MQTNAITQSKMEIATEIGRMESAIAKQESVIKELEQSRNSAKGNRTAGAAAALIGLLLVLFLSNLWYIGVFLILIGALTLFTAMSKQTNAEREIKGASDSISEMRGKLAEKRAML